MKGPVGVAALLILGVAGCAGDDAAPEPGGPPSNVVVLLIDTLRPDHLEGFGYERETAPFLSELARRSVVFERAFSTSSWTAPATASVFTGVYPTRHGVTAGFRAQSQGQRREAREAGTEEVIRLRGMPGDLATLPEIMRDAGYRTFGVAANLNIGSELGFDRGFDRFDELHGEAADVLVDRIVDLREEMQAAAPYFLYAHFNDPHEPYRRRTPWYTPDEDETTDAISRYDSEIRFMDESLARLHREMGWEESTVLVVASDHGEELMQRGKMSHGFSLFDELNRVLLIVRAPGLDPARRAGVNASLVDVLPTVLDLAGVPPIEGRDGQSLESLEAGSASAESRAVFAHRGRASGSANLWAVIDGRFKLIVSDDNDPDRLYDLDSDPGELVNLAGEEPELAARLRKRLDEFSTSVSVRDRDVEIPLDPELLEKLEALGYVGADH